MLQEEFPWFFHALYNVGDIMGWTPVIFSWIILSPNTSKMLMTKISEECAKTAGGIQNNFYERKTNLETTKNNIWNSVHDNKTMEGIFSVKDNGRCDVKWAINDGLNEILKKIFHKL